MAQYFLKNEKMTPGTEFLPIWKSCQICLSIKPENFSVSGGAAQYFLYLRRPKNQLG